MGRWCAGAGQLRRALACLIAMSAGATERSQLSNLPCWRRAAAEHVPLATSARELAGITVQCAFYQMWLHAHAWRCISHDCTLGSSRLTFCCEVPRYQHGIGRYISCKHDGRT